MGQTNGKACLDKRDKEEKAGFLSEV